MSVSVEKLISTGWRIAVATILLGQCSVPRVAAQRTTRGFDRPSTRVLERAYFKNASYSSVGTAVSATNAKDEKIAGNTFTLLPNGNLLSIGGQVGNHPTTAVFIRDLAADTSRQLSNGLVEARYGHTATVLPNGAVLIFGGIGSDGQVLQDGEIFDPATLTFQAVNTAGLTPRAFHTATLITDGRVLIAGGISKSGKSTDTLEVWDYRISLGQPASFKLRIARQAHTGSLRSDGSVLLWGGIDAEGKQLTTGEIIYPTLQLTQILQNKPVDSDTAIPSISESIPLDGAQDVPLSVVVDLRFSRQLAVTSITDKTVTLRGPKGNVPVSVIPAEAGMLAFVTPSQELLAGSEYVLAIQGATDTSGTQLSDTTIRFTTEGGAQSPAAPSGAPPAPADPFNSPARKLPPLQAHKGVTAVSGQVLQLNGEPLLNTTLQIGDRVTRTDRTGRFLLTDVPSGHHVMWIDGSTAQNRDLTYGIYEDGVDIVAKKTNVLDYTIWMTALDTTDEVTLPSPTDREMIVTNALLPGLELHLPAGAVIHDRNDKLVTKIGITPIPVNQPPFPLPKGVRVPIYFTIQPGGAYLEGYDEPGGTQGARLFYPNTYNQPPQSSFNFWNYDADSKGWYVYGQGFVTADAKQVVPNPGVVIYEFTGAMVGGPPGPPLGPPPGCTGPPATCVAGDPVNLETGLFVYSKTDLALPDIIPIQLTRTYRQMDPVSHAFGIGTMSNYDIYLIGDGSAYTYMDLIQPDGGRIHYDRVSPGTSWTDAVLKCLVASTPYYGSQIVWNGTGWTLSMKNGSKMFFPESSGATNFLQAALIGTTDRNGNALTFTRDPNNNLTRITSPNGRWIQYTYDPSNRVTQASDNAGRTVFYTYDTNGRLSTVKDANSGTTTFGYDTNNNMTTIKDPRNITYITNYYDTHNMVSKQVMVDGSTYLFKYVLNSGGIDTTYVKQGLTASETDVTDPRGNVRKVFFNADGFMSSEIRASGKPEQQAVTYNVQAGTGLLLGITDGLNRTTSYTYDSMGNTTSVTHLSGTPNATTTSFVYESQFNQLASVTDAVGRTVAFQHDATGNLIGITNADGSSSSLSYNPAGQLVSATDAAGNTTQMAYLGGDLSGITDPLQRAMSYFVDEAGRVASITNPLGQSVQTTFDSLNQIMQIVDPSAGSTAFGYDPNGNTTSVTDARNTANPTTFIFDNMDRLQTKTDPLGNPDSSIYDPNGNLIRYTDRRGKITSYQYDGLDRLTFVGFGTQAGPAFESTITYTWDAGNRLTQASDSIAGTMTVGYDNLDHVASVTSPQGSISYTTDAIGRRLTMTVTGQPQISYSYDTGNRLTQITQGTVNVQLGYDSVGRRTSMLQPNGVLATYAYDAASQLTSLTYSKASLPIGDLQYSYDGAGRESSVTGSFARTVLPQAMTGNVYNAANQLTQSRSMPLTYDVNGNLTNDGLHTYSWDARNHLVSIDSGGAATYAYDPFGRRITKTISGVASTNILYDGANPVQELSAGSPTANLLTGGVDEIFTRTDSSGTSTLLTDALGSTVALTDTNGTVQTQYSYEPFGNTTVSGASTTNSFAYTGREIDTAGLYYYRSRYYSPATGRFLSEDPIGIAGGINLYAYTSNNPLNYTDPLGTSNSIVHVYETYQGARSAELGMLDSATLGLMVAAVDFNGTQDTSAVDANQHGMSGYLPDGPVQTPKEAHDGTADFVRSMAGRKNGLWDFARGLHAVQDSYSGSHDYRPWYGNSRNMAHQGPDAYWHQDAIDATRDYLSGAGADAVNPNMPPKPYYGRRPTPFWF
ncbi:MAG: Ig-like domain-containing protein [Acidobacteria bacterium]|nr:Ig-like domain-containing protein [Acidobacteriota bacterium]